MPSMKIVNNTVRNNGRKVIIRNKKKQVSDYSKKME